MLVVFLTADSNQRSRDLLLSKATSGGEALLFRG